MNQSSSATQTPLSLKGALRCIVYETIHLKELCFDEYDVLMLDGLLRWREDLPIHIKDDTATMPEDWDEEDDGVWVAPDIPNPACRKLPGCGEWVAPLVRNPEYKVLTDLAFLSVG